ITLVMTLAGVFFSNRARTSAHIAFVTLTGVLGDFIKDLERAGRKGETLSSRYRSNGYTPNLIDNKKGARRRLLLYSNSRQAISAVVSKSKVSSPSLRSM
ncbi:hypothetical protein, partial [Pseudomonas sp. GL-B-26]|uniref:hypothetical protein n=1 Tax=Pseudomonas sp. GL-B-26 TaxID=2832394 RepID=UPI001CC04FF0